MLKTHPVFYRTEWPKCSNAGQTHWWKSILTVFSHWLNMRYLFTRSICVHVILFNLQKIFYSLTLVHVWTSHRIELQAKRGILTWLSGHIWYKKSILESSGKCTYDNIQQKYEIEFGCARIKQKRVIPLIRVMIACLLHIFLVIWL